MPSSAEPTKSQGPDRPQVVVVVFENTEYDAIIGSPEAPYINGLAARSVLLTSSFGVTHPSLPNYLALLGGSTFGVDSNCTDCIVRRESLVDQMERAGISWKAYMEGAPEPCFTGDASGDYRKRHNPFVYFENITRDPARCRKVVPLSDLTGDLEAGGLPGFTWVTPDLCHDMHDCDISVGDAWAGQWVAKLAASLGPGGVLILTFDEGTTDAGCCAKAAGGHIVTIIAGPGAATGVRLDGPVDHYSILRLIEDRWGLERLNEAACACTPSITGWEA